jgi:thiamine-phosphate pyrophosphorylase
MPRRHPLPRIWLMTDERQGDMLWAAIERLPRGSGIVFRHHNLSATERRALFAKVKQLARRRGQTVLLAGPRRAWGADGSHGRGRAPGLRTAPVHDLAELRAAERAGAALVFLSPVFATRSHPGAEPLGPRRFVRLARRASVPVIALGGMTAGRFRALSGAYGWAAIDAWGTDGSETDHPGPAAPV